MCSACFLRMHDAYLHVLLKISQFLVKSCFGNTSKMFIKPTQALKG